MEIITNYDLAPGQCRLCRTARLPAVDTGLDYDGQGYDGRLYICAICAAALYSMTAGAAGAPGLVPAYRYNELSERNRLLETQVSELTTALEAVRGDGTLAETLRSLAGTLDRSPAEEVATGGVPSAATEPVHTWASLPPHPTDEQVAEAEAREPRNGDAAHKPDVEDDEDPKGRPVGRSAKHKGSHK
jgi:hypothetical protein